MIEVLIGLTGSAFIGYIVNKLERMEQKIDAIEIEIVLIKAVVPKRSSDL